ncbi:DUF4238 domain-containing protein [Rhizobium sp. LEGMi198b]
MSEHRSQHYVPRCYLKNFSSEISLRCINLLNINRELSIRNAPIKNQCEKSFFYGKDLVIEKSLQNIEGDYSRIAASIVKEEILRSEEIEFLRQFTYLQYLRTDYAAKRMQIAHSEMADLIYEFDSDSRPKDAEEVSILLELFDSTKHSIDDLKFVIIKNETRTNFITSDDPAIVTNRFPKSTGDLGAAGLNNSGCILFLPINPIYSISFYDGGIYTLPDKLKYTLRLKKYSDVKALNQLQIIKAQKNIYFSTWQERDELLAELCEIKDKRPSKWHEIHYAIEDPQRSQDGLTSYRAVYTAEERKEAQRALIHLHQIPLVPSSWPSAIKFRRPARYIDTKSGAGLIRRHMSR